MKCYGSNYNSLTGRTKNHGLACDLENVKICSADHVAPETSNLHQIVNERYSKVCFILGVDAPVQMFHVKVERIQERRDQNNEQKTQKDPTIESNFRLLT